MKKEVIKSANPYLPLWEHIPDGEPRVFEFEGEKRVWIYGSHDTKKTEYCGPDQMVWSAPVDDLTDWTCHGVCFVDPEGGNLFAPDVVQKGDTFYMYAAKKNGGEIVLATSKNPAGPFKEVGRTELGFDPGVLVDDDGKVYGFFGFCGMAGAEVNEDMMTIKKDTLKTNIIGHCRAPWSKEDGAVDFKYGFFEASSPRKILGKYVYIYSRRTNEPVPELGLTEDCNGFLSYAYSDSPLDGYEFGGDIHFNGGEIIKHKDGTYEHTYTWCNNHGSLMEINGQWYIFCHKRTGTNEFSRQGMIEPVDVALDKNGKLYIGKITYENGEPVKCEPVEMTSQGARVDGIPCDSIISAGYAVHIRGGEGTAYTKPVYEKSPTTTSPVVGISNGTTVGIRYVAFGPKSPETVTVAVLAKADLKVSVIVDSYDGKCVASADVEKLDDYQEVVFDLDCAVIGKRAVYFKFESKATGEIAEFDYFTFD